MFCSQQQRFWAQKHISNPEFAVLKKKLKGGTIFELKKRELDLALISKKGARSLLISKKGSDALRVGWTFKGSDALRLDV